MSHPPATASAVTLPSHALRRIGDSFSVRSVDFRLAAATGLSVFGLDHFQVSQQPFGPHPHAGFSAITYVLPDSPGGLRSRDSLGGDVIVGPGGIVWLQAGSGAIHEELPATPGVTLHGLQVFVNLPARDKLIAPRVLSLDGPDVPTWQGPAGDTVRVVAGRFGDRVSPLRPAQAFRWLDLDLHTSLSVDLPLGEVTLAYLLQGHVRLHCGPHDIDLQPGHAVSLAAGGSPLACQADRPSHMVLLSSPAIHEPMVGNGPFVMADEDQLREAVRRYQSGGMGSLAPMPAR